METDPRTAFMQLVEAVSDLAGTLDAMKGNLEARGWPTEYACQASIATMAPLLLAVASANAQGGSQ